MDEQRTGPLTWGQRWHWLDGHLPPEKRQLHLPAVHCRVPDGATAADTHAALVALAARHESLRTTFSATRPMQRVGAHTVPKPAVAELGDEPLHEGVLHRVAAQLLPAGFDIEAAPPWRAVLLMRDGVPRELLLLLHHLLVDGWSCKVLTDELGALLGGAHMLPPVRWQPLDQARAEAGPRVRGDSDRALEHWRTCLDAATFNLLAPLRGEGADAGVCHRFTALLTGAARDAAALAAAHSVSPSTVLTAAFACAVLERAGAEQLFVDLVVANRFAPGAAGGVGSMALLGVLPVRVAPGAGFAAVLVETGRHAVRALRHGYCDPCQLRALELAQRARRGVHLQSTLVVNVHAYGDELPLLLAAQDREPDTVTVTDVPAPGPFDTVYVDLTPRPDGLLVDLYAGDGALSAEQTRQLLDRVRDLLGSAADAPARRLGRAASPAPGWVRVGPGWVSLPRTEALLRRCPHIATASVRCAGDELVATVVSAAAGATVEEIRDWVADRLADEPHAMAPHRYELDGPVPAGRAPRAPSDIERALLGAVAAEHRAGGLDQLRPGVSYAAAGGEFVAVPAVLDRLRRSGYAGLALDDFTSGRSLSFLAARLAPVD